MTNSDIIEMAREAGLHRQQHNLMSNPVQYRFSYEGYEENLKLFAELVRADAIAEEREACAKVCESIDDYDENVDTYYSDIYAKAIRARGETK